MFRVTLLVFTNCAHFPRAPNIGAETAVAPKAHHQLIVNGAWALPLHLSFAGCRVGTSKEAARSRFLVLIVRWPDSHGKDAVKWLDRRSLWQGRE